jgi:hypothetical protein
MFPYICSGHPTGCPFLWLSISPLQQADIQAIIGQNQDEKKPRERGKRRDKIKNRQKA